MRTKEAERSIFLGPLSPSRFAPFSEFEKRTKAKIVNPSPSKGS